jgi:hypothetical protein
MKMSLRSSWKFILPLIIVVACSQQEEIKPEKVAVEETSSDDQTSASNARAIDLSSYFTFAPEGVITLNGDHVTRLKLIGRKRFCAPTSTLRIRYTLLTFNANTGIEESRIGIFQENGKSTCIIPLAKYGIVSQHLDSFEYISYTSRPGERKIIQVLLTLWDSQTGEHLGDAFTRKILVPLI